MKAVKQSVFETFKVTFADAAVSVTFDGRTATALKVSPSVKASIGFSMPDTPTDGLSIIARVDQIDEMEPGDPVTVGLYGHIVTSCSTDELGAIYTIGLSQPFDKEASFTGTRKEGSGSRELFLTVPCIISGGQSDDAQSGSFLPSSERVFMIVIRSVDWSDAGKPQAGDTVKITDYADMKVVSSIPVLGGWNLTLKTKGAD